MGTNSASPVAWAHPEDIVCDGYTHTFVVRSEQPVFIDGSAAVGLYSEHCVEELWRVIGRLESQVKDLTLRNKVLRERPDLPADRIPAHNTVVQLQQENSNLKSLLGASHDSP